MKDPATLIRTTRQKPTNLTKPCPHQVKGRVNPTRAVQQVLETVPMFARGKREDQTTQKMWQHERRERPAATQSELSAPCKPAGSNFERQMRSFARTPCGKAPAAATLCKKGRIRRKEWRHGHEVWSPDHHPDHTTSNLTTAKTHHPKWSNPSYNFTLV